MKFKLTTYIHDLELFLWLDQLRPDNNYRYMFIGDNQYLDIDNEEDAFLFQLKWSEFIQ